MMYQIQSPRTPPSFTVGIDRDQSSSRAHHPSHGMPFYQSLLYQGTRRIYCKRTAFHHFKRAGTSDLSADFTYLSTDFRGLDGSFYRFRGGFL